MCLSQVTVQDPKRSARIGEGWVSNGGWVGYTIGYFGYESGVHAYITVKDALAHSYDNHVIVKVRLTGPICKGNDFGIPVVVYKEMKILSEVKPKTKKGQK